MDGFQKRTLKKRKAILDASLDLFNQYGYKNVTISQISKQAHVSLDTIYNYFESKDNLKKELLKQIIDRYLSIVEDIINSDRSAMEKLEQMLLSKVEYSRQFSQEFLTEELNNLNYTEFFGGKEKKLLLRKMEEMLIEQGIAEHVITSEVSSKAVVTFFEIIQYYITHNFGLTLQMSKDNLLNELCFLFVNGLKIR
jgi:AcrR family transcriptional regulator